MHRQRSTEDDQEPQRSRPTSRRNSISRRNSLKKETEGKKTLNSAPTSTTSTPKKTVKPQNLDFVVTGKQILKRSDRANSLPGSYHRRPSADSSRVKKVEPVKRHNVSQSSRSQETSLEDDVSLDLSQVSDFEDTNSKYGVKQPVRALATSTPKPKGVRSQSLQSQLHTQGLQTRKGLASLDNIKNKSYSKDSFKTSISSPRYCTELDYSSVSPEYSGQSSGDLSPSRASQLDVTTPRSQELQLSSCCVSTWAEGSEGGSRQRGGGEWATFWSTYNSARLHTYYEQCPTPHADLNDFELSTESSRKLSPDNIETINNVIRHQGLHLTPRETQNMIKCAHLLGNVLSKAIERRTKCEKPSDSDNQVTVKNNLTLDLKDPIAVEVMEEKKSETVTTQTDISLPNTKSAPRIFENILRQLSRNSIDVDKLNLNKEKEAEAPAPVQETPKEEEKK